MHAAAAVALLVVEPERTVAIEAARAHRPVIVVAALRACRPRQRHRFASRQHLRHRVEHGLLLNRTLRLPQPKAHEQRDRQQRQHPSDHEAAPAAHARFPSDCDNAAMGAHVSRRSTVVKTLLIIAVLILILWNLGAGLYYMLVDKGEGKRTVNALTRRIALSIALIIGVVIAAEMGWIEFHDIGRKP